MCDIRTYRRIEKAVETVMAFKQMFTAYDITLSLQRQGVRKRHRELRRDIKRIADQLIWRYGYERTLVELAGGGAQAFVYHPYGTDANLHQPAARARRSLPAARRQGVSLAALCAPVAVD